jgi:NADH-quinone oxidoreductase subunit A
MQGWLSILLMIVLAAAFAVGSIILSRRFFGPSNPTAEKLAPYECGMPPVGGARERHPVKFYLVAMMFLLFDVEIAFLYPYALAVHDLGWSGFTIVLIFLAILTAGFVYEWKKGALDWDKP